MNKKHFISNNILLQLGFLLLILFVFGLLVYNMSTFIPGLLGALCLYVLLLHPLRWMVYTKKFNKTASVIALIIGSAILIIGPLYLLIQMLTNKIMVMLNDTVQIQSDIKKAIDTVHNQFNIDVFSENNIGKITQVGIKLLEKTLNASVDMTIQLGVAFLILFFMLMNNKKLENWFYANMPFRHNNLLSMNNDMKDLVVSNAIGVPLTAFLQAVVAYIGYLIFGVDDAFTWFILTVFAAMLPIVGAAIIYVPLSVILLTKGDTASAIGLVLYGFLVVGLADNLIRFMLQKKMADVHPLITIFGVIVGINLFGFIGIIFGPILFSLFIWLMKLYKFEFIDPNPEDSCNNSDEENNNNSIVEETDPKS